MTTAEASEDERAGRASDRATRSGWRSATRVAREFGASVWAARLAERVTVGVCALFAWQRRFIQDDAFISLVYARNWLEGRGLVWSAGERVEGYTNFAWTLLQAALLKITDDVERALYVTGVVLFVGSLLAFGALARHAGLGPFARVAATAALGTLPTFSAYATGGLETQLQTCLALISALGWRRLAQGGSSRHAVGLGLVLVLAMLTRLDSAVLLAPMGVVAAGASVRWAAPGRRVASLWQTVAIPLAVVVVGVGVWFWWKWGFYGTLLPNTFYAKVGVPGGWQRGLGYLAGFVWSYGFAPVLVAACAAGLALRRSRRGFETILVSLPALCWLGYVAAIGGDFMEYRMLVPVLPLLLLMAFVGVNAWGSSRLLAAGLAVCVVAGGEHHRRYYAPARYGGPEAIGSLAGHLADDVGAWREIGRRLGDAFGDLPKPPIIAVTAAGVIPYESRLPAIDMLGLNDASVAAFEHVNNMIVGHNRLISIDSLLERNAHLLIAHPVIVARGLDVAGDPHRAFSTGRFFRFPDEERLRRHRVIQMPLSRSRSLLMVYLTENAALTARSVDLGWKIHSPKPRRSKARRRAPAR